MTVRNNVGWCTILTSLNKRMTAPSGAKHKTTTMTQTHTLFHVIVICEIFKFSF